MITGHPSKTRNWINEYFFIRVNKASVPDLDRRYRSEWSPIFVRPDFWRTPPVNFFDDVRRLSEHGKRKWEDIAEARIKAQWARIASGGADLGEEVTADGQFGEEEEEERVGREAGGEEEGENGIRVFI
ncbi:unnamed protein product [Microthlaspi erraticum]|uniref:Uncharacterized protein n=1 Tax=Microthlaspi erraticum TaxID=1685480 RepID=A0A6D2J515_9BRAS|nr:unnamed protein product [Microthlaspi erraticum]